MTDSTLVQSRERPALTFNGLLVLGIVVMLFLLAANAFWQATELSLGPALRQGRDAGSTWFLLGMLFGATAIITIWGFYSLQPNESAAILLFGDYAGTDRSSGLRWVFPWYTRKKISVRVHNITSQTLKVNDRRGNPIEIAAVVVWRVVDTAQALFDVVDYPIFVNIQIETALREIASHFAYDDGDVAGEPTLRANGDDVAALLREKLQDRVMVAGVAVDETKLSHLAYAPEIAGAMLKRQQAEAILAARQKIVRGAVDMVENALSQLGERGVVALEGKERAAMVSNLLVILCGDREAQPVVNTGS